VFLNSVNKQPNFFSIFHLKLFYFFAYNYKEFFLVYFKEDGFNKYFVQY